MFDFLFKKDPVQQPSTSWIPQMTKRNILIVEDEATIAGMYQQLLSNHGYDVSVAANGKEGLEKVRQSSPELILLDVMMPVMDGKQMLNALRTDPAYEQWKHIPVIMLTNMGDIDTIKVTTEQGKAVEYLIKSNIKPADIIEKIKKYL